jgi:hypothetical protein
MGVHPVWQAVPLPCRRPRPLAVARVARRRLMESIDRAFAYFLAAVVSW